MDIFFHDHKMFKKKVKKKN